MIILLLLIVVAVWFWFLAIRSSEEECFAVVTVFSLLVAGSFALAVILSYTTSVEAEAVYQSLALTHSQAIEVYEGKTVLHLDSLTDFRYAGYQESMSGLIRDVRDEVYEYNRLIIRKRILRRNIFFGWYVHSPDLPVIELKEIIQD